MLIAAAKHGKMDWGFGFRVFCVLDLLVLESGNEALAEDAVGWEARVAGGGDRALAVPDGVDRPVALPAVDLVILPLLVERLPT